MEKATFQLVLTGDTADQHEFQGYDGYMALAGFAWALSLITNYVETAEIRQRREFAGRSAVRAGLLEEGSLIANFSVWLEKLPKDVFGPNADGSSAHLLYELVKRVIDRNLGSAGNANDTQVNAILDRRSGDIETLVAISEAPLRQAHSVIGNGAKKVKIVGGHRIIRTFDEGTRDYMKLNYEDPTLKKIVTSVSSFNGNSGHGSVFDTSLGKNVPFSMSRDTLRKYGSVFSWGLHQYITKTGKKVEIEFSRILAMDETPKRYVISNAEVKQ